VKKARKFDHKVLEIDGIVKGIVNTYILMFPNQKEAAKSIGVSACTINTYHTRSTHIALYVFEKIVRELTRKLGREEIDKALGGRSVEDFRKSAKRQNGAQIDNVMYVINPKIRDLLDIYVERFPSREAGGSHLGLNPRTFTAYFKGQIVSFPRRHFWRVIEDLGARGITENQLFDRLSISSWEDILEEKERSRTLDLSRQELLSKIVDNFKRGSLKERDFSRSVANAAERVFGNLGSAIRAAMKEIGRTTLAAMRDKIRHTDFEGAAGLLNQFESFAMLYRSKETQVNKALPRNKKMNIERLMKPYLKISLEAQDVLQESLTGTDFSLYRTESPYDELDQDTPVHKRKKMVPTEFKIVRRYAFSERFRLGEVIDHPGLGIGTVVSVRDGNRMVVKFQNKKYGVKELVMNGVAYPEY
jgi:hypothetical protein